MITSMKGSCSIKELCEALGVSRSGYHAACARPVAKNVSRKTVGRQPKKFSKRELYAMLADAVRNAGYPAHRYIVAARPPHLVQFERFPYCRQSPMHLNAPWR